MTTNAVVKLAIVFCALSATATAQTLNAKPGLWEITSTPETKGAPPIPADAKARMEKELAKMPPAQRAQMEAAIKSSLEEPVAPTVTKSCITKEDLTQPFAMAGMKPDDVCKRTVVKFTPTMQEIRLDCTAKTGKSTGTAQFVMVTPEHWNGTVDGSISDANGTYNVKMKMNGKWMGAACGDVKPAVRK